MHGFFLVFVQKPNIPCHLLFRYLYKENYEHFKYYVTIISFVFAVLLWFLPQIR